MKVLLLQILALQVITMRAVAQSLAVPAATVMAVNVRLAYPDILLGKWEQCATKWRKRTRNLLGKSTEEEYQLLANVCSEFIFRMDHTGSYKSGGGFLQDFTWQMVGNRLIVTNTPARTKTGQEAGGLADCSYNMLFNSKELRFVELALTNSQGTSYILTK